MAIGISGPVKIKEGLFVGDECAAKDLEFMAEYGITHVLNCCGQQVPNHWEAHGIVYLAYEWDADNPAILSPNEIVANQTFRFIEEALEASESVLIHSAHGQSRSCCVLFSYIMKKYSWGLRKTMQFLSLRRPDMNLKPGLFQQLSGYEMRLMAQATMPLSSSWHDTDFSSLEDQELLLQQNTYINSCRVSHAVLAATKSDHRQVKRVSWSSSEDGVDECSSSDSKSENNHDQHNLKEPQHGEHRQRKFILKSPMSAGTLPSGSFVSNSSFCTYGNSLVEIRRVFQLTNTIIVPVMERIQSA